VHPHMSNKKAPYIVNQIIVKQIRSMEKVITGSWIFLILRVNWIIFNTKRII